MNGFSYEFVEVPKIGPSIEKQVFRPYIGLEDEFQKSVAKHLDLIGADWFHCPNGGSRNKIEAGKLKAMGVKKGVSDCIILDQLQGYLGFIIELKVGKNTPTKEQLQFIERESRRNKLTLISWSLDEVIFWIDWYFNIK